MKSLEYFGGKNKKTNKNEIHFVWLYIAPIDSEVEYHIIYCIFIFAFMNITTYVCNLFLKNLCSVFLTPISISLMILGWGWPFIVCWLMWHFMYTQWHMFASSEYIYIYICIYIDIYIYVFKYSYIWKRNCVFRNLLLSANDNFYLYIWFLLDSLLIVKMTWT